MSTPARTGTVTTKTGLEVPVERDDDLRQYVARVDGRTAVVAEFLLTDELVVFTHTETDQQFEGQGIASALVAWALDDVRQQARTVLPTCPFVAGFIGRHQEEYADLVYRSRTATVHD